MENNLWTLRVSSTKLSARYEKIYIELTFKITLLALLSIITFHWKCHRCMKKNINPSVVFLCLSLFSHAAQCCIFQHDNVWGELSKLRVASHMKVFCLGFFLKDHCCGNSYSEFQQITHFWWVYSLVILQVYRRMAATSDSCFYV